ncbi:MAG: hypothetical protein VCF25_00710 [Candidatus Poribacteria bacterium]|jgi:hypothetical protein
MSHVIAFVCGVAIPFLMLRAYRYGLEGFREHKKREENDDIQYFR